MWGRGMPRPHHLIENVGARHASPITTSVLNCRGEASLAPAGMQDRGMASDRICVGQIGGAHGIRGEGKLKSFTADPMAIKDYAPLESQDGATRFVIEALRPAKGHLVARLHGIADRTAAERLTHLKLF